MSLLQAGRFRRLAANALGGVGVAVDLGSGPGYTAAEACRAGLRGVVLLDASPETLQVAPRIVERECNSGHVEVAAIFESLPFPDCTVDAAVATFSIRDAIDRERAIREIARILKPRGRLVVVDIYKPSNPMALLAAKAYFTITPFIGALLTGCPQLAGEYLGLARTIDRMETFEGLKGLLARYFKIVKGKTLLPATGIWVAEEPRKPCGAPP